MALWIQGGIKDNTMLFKRATQFQNVLSDSREAGNKDCVVFVATVHAAKASWVVFTFAQRHFRLSSGQEAKYGTIA